MKGIARPLDYRPIAYTISGKQAGASIEEFRWEVII
jgi:hypothetical protein